MDGLEQRIDRAVRGQTQPTVTILSSLLAVEDELSYIPREAVGRIADFTRSTINDVWAVASFYPNFRFDPPPIHRIEVCWGTSCHLVGAMAVVKAVLETAGLEGEGDTGRPSTLGALQHLPGRLRPSPRNVRGPSPARTPDPEYPPPAGFS